MESLSNDLDNLKLNISLPIDSIDRLEITRLIDANDCENLIRYG